MEDILNYYKGVLHKYAVFTGRARRSEYWYFALVNVVIGIILGLFGSFGKSINMVYSLAILIPSIAVGVRRLHDTNRSGWWLLLLLIPVIGWIVLIVFMATEGTAADNQYGPNPKGSSSPVPAAEAPAPMPPSSPQM